jgi:hypothetical protein
MKKIPMSPVTQLSLILKHQGGEIEISEDLRMNILKDPMDLRRTEVLLIRLRRRPQALPTGLH